jgi:hypothetical protein
MANHTLGNSRRTENTDMAFKLGLTGENIRVSGLMEKNMIDMHFIQIIKGSLVKLNGEKARYNNDIIRSSYAI